MLFKLILFLEDQLLERAFLKHLLQHAQVLLVLFGLNAVEAYRGGLLILRSLFFLPRLGFVHAEQLGQVEATDDVVNFVVALRSLWLDLRLLILGRGVVLRVASSDTADSVTADGWKLGLCDGALCKILITRPLEDFRSFRLLLKESMAPFRLDIRCLGHGGDHILICSVGSLGRLANVDIGQRDELFHSGSLLE